MHIRCGIKIRSGYFQNLSSDFSLNDIGTERIL